MAVPMRIKSALRETFLNMRPPSELVSQCVPTLLRVQPIAVIMTDGTDPPPRQRERACSSGVNLESVISLTRDCRLRRTWCNRHATSISRRETISRENHCAEMAAMLLVIVECIVHSRFTTAEIFASGSHLLQRCLVASPLSSPHAVAIPRAPSQARHYLRSVVASRAVQLRSASQPVHHLRRLAGWP